MFDFLFFNLTHSSPKHGVFLRKYYIPTDCSGIYYRNLAKYLFTYIYKYIYMEDRKAIKSHLILKKCLDISGKVFFSK